MTSDKISSDVFKKLFSYILFVIKKDKVPPGNYANRIDLLNLDKTSFRVLENDRLIVYISFTRNFLSYFYDYYDRDSVHFDS